VPIVDCESHPEFVEGMGKLTHMFRQTQHDNTHSSPAEMTKKWNIR